MEQTFNARADIAGSHRARTVIELHHRLRSLDVPTDLPRDALVVRGGDPHDPENLPRMLRQAQDSFDEGEGYALSVYIGYDPTKSRAELIAEIATVGKLPQSRLVVTTLGQVADTQLFSIYPDGPLPGHANIDLGSELSEDVVKQLIELFGPAEENPAHQQFKRRR